MHPETQSPATGDTTQKLIERLAATELRLRETTLDVYATLGMTNLRDLQFQVSDFSGLFGSNTSIAPPWYQQNQKFGEALPVYRTEVELRLIRDRSRILAASNEFALCALEARANYVVGDGFKYSASPKDPKSAANRRSAECVQAVIDGWVEINNLPELEADALWRLDVEGEFFVRCFNDRKGWQHLRFVEPEHVTYPGGDTNDPEKSFGVVTPADDTETVEAYSVVEDPLNGTWDAKRVSASKILHVKANTRRGSKRGLPTFYPVESNLRRCEELLASMSSIAKARAKIALIRKISGLTSPTAASLLNTLTAVRATDPATNETLNIERLRYGTVLTASGNTDYEMPSMQLGASDIIEVLQAELRAVASRMQMAEWMFTALADAKYSNAFAVEAPTLKSFGKLQRIMRQGMALSRYGHRKSLLWRQLDRAVEAGLLSPDDLDGVVLACVGPTLEARDRMQEVERHKELVAAGFESKETAQRSLELDPDVETPLIEQETVGKARPVADANAVAQIQGQFYAGQLPRDAAAANLQILLGFTREQADALLPASDCVNRVDNGQDPAGADGMGGAPGGGDAGVGAADGGGAAPGDAVGGGGAPDAGIAGQAPDAADQLLQAAAGQLSEQATPAPVALTLREAGFTGVVTASNGVVYHYADGVRVSAKDHEEHVAKTGKASPVVAKPDPTHFEHLIHLVGEHYAKGEVGWKVAGKAIDKLLKKYGGGLAEWQELAAKFGLSTDKKSSSELIGAIKQHLETAGADPAKIAAVKGEAPAEQPAEEKPEEQPAEEKPAAKLADEHLDVEDPEHEAAAAEVFGPGVTGEMVARAAGAPPGTKAKIASVHEGVVTVLAGDEGYEPGAAVDGVSLYREFYRDADGKLVVKNVQIATGGGMKGKGTQVFADQVEAAKKLGVAYMVADGSKTGGENGYYTLPRWGYDGAVPPAAAAKLPPDLKAAAGNPPTLGGLMSTPEGRAWWKANGVGVEGLKFDLQDGSASLAKLSAYATPQPSAEPQNAPAETPADEPFGGPPSPPAPAPTAAETAAEEIKSYVGAHANGEMSAEDAHTAVATALANISKAGGTMADAIAALQAAGVDTTDHAGPFSATDAHFYPVAPEPAPAAAAAPPYAAPAAVDTGSIVAELNDTLAKYHAGHMGGPDYQAAIAQTAKWAHQNGISPTAAMKAAGIPDDTAGLVMTIAGLDEPEPAAAPAPTAAPADPVKAAAADLAAVLGGKGLKAVKMQKIAELKAKHGAHVVSQAFKDAGVFTFGTPWHGSKNWNATKFKDMAAKLQAHAGGTVATVTATPAAAPAAAKPAPKPPKPTSGAGALPDGDEAAANVATLPGDGQANYAGKQGHEVDPTWKPHPTSQAYGGVVTRTDPATGKTQVLLRRPTNDFGGYVWTFPKGKKDQHPDAQTAALAEVAEETGHKGQVVGHLPGTFTSDSDSTTNYFLMHSTGEDKSLMDTETAATQWVDLDKAHELIGQTKNAAGKARDLAVLEAAKQHLGAPVALGSATGHKPAGVATLPAASAVPPQWAALDSLPKDKAKIGAVVLRVDPKTGKVQALPTLAGSSLVSGTPGVAALAAVKAVTGGDGKVVGHVEQPLGSGGQSQHGMMVTEVPHGTAGNWLDLEEAHKQALASAGSPTAQERVNAAFAKAKELAAGVKPDPVVDAAAAGVAAAIPELAAAKANPGAVASKVAQLLSGLHPSAIDAAAAKLGAKSAADLVAHVQKQVAAPGAGIPSVAKLQGVKPIGEGSTGAKVGSLNGAKFAVKDGGTTQHGQEQVVNEVAADKIYSLLGANVPPSKLDVSGGKNHKVAEWVDGQKLGDYLKTATPEQAAKVKKELQKHFVATALLGNWDVVGLNHDNIKVDKNGVPHLIDNGGSFDISANASKKGAAAGKPFGATVSELDTLIDPKTAPQAAGVFAGVTKADIKAQIANVIKQKAAILAATPAAHKSTMEARIAHLQKWAATDGKPNALKLTHATHGDVWVDPAPGVSISTHSLAAVSHPAAVEYLSRVTPEEASAVQTYTGGSYKALNHALYTKKGFGGSPSMQKLDDGLQAAFAKASKVPPLTLVRRFDIKDMPNPAKFVAAMEAAAKSGTPFKWRNYQSAGPGTTWSGDSKVTFENVTEGVIDVRPISLHPSEQELLLNRGTFYRVKSMTKNKSGGHDFVMEQVPAEEAAKGHFLEAAASPAGESIETPATAEDLAARAAEQKRHGAEQFFFNVVGE
jgi:8-oxo-dGTP pyrophosphatase MutT (NUDIX family)